MKPTISKWRTVTSKVKSNLECRDTLNAFTLIINRHIKWLVNHVRCTPKIQAYNHQYWISLNTSISICPRFACSSTINNQLITMYKWQKCISLSGESGILNYPRGNNRAPLLKRYQCTHLMYSLPAYDLLEFYVSFVVLDQREG